MQKECVCVGGGGSRRGILPCVCVLPPAEGNENEWADKVYRIVLRTSLLRKEYRVAGMRNKNQLVFIYGERRLSPWDEGGGEYNVEKPGDGVGMCVLCDTRTYYEYSSFQLQGRCIIYIYMYNRVFIHVVVGQQQLLGLQEEGGGGGEEEEFTTCYLDGDLCICVSVCVCGYCGYCFVACVF